MAKARVHDKAQARRAVAARMERLLDLAAEAEPERSARYVRLAWRLSTRHRVRMGPEMKGRFCRRCFGYLVPGESVRTRVEKGRIVTTCLHCGTVRRRPLRGGSPGPLGKKSRAPREPSRLVGAGYYPASLRDA